MPYKLVGNCVHKENADKTAGELVKCHENHQQAVNHLRALYANVENSAFAEFSMAIVKTSSKNGVMKWRSVNSDTDSDYYTEKMSVELFNDFVRRIEDEEPFPEEFKDAICEEGWCGGMPYVSLAHYKSGGPERKNVPGKVLTLYVDGDKLKSTGEMFDTPLGKSIFRSLEKDIVEKRVEGKIRISIGFLDLEHSHGDKFTFTRKSVSDKCHLCSEHVGDKIYKKGILVHLALTRIPANPRTDLEVEKSVMTTKLDDLKSLVEDEDVLKDLQLKSQAEPEILVIKTNDNDEDEAGKCKEGDEECEKKMRGEMEKKSVTPAEDTAESTVLTPAPVAAPVPVIPAPAVPEPTALHKSLAEFETTVIELKSKGLPGESALQELQPAFDRLAEVIRSEVNPPKPADPKSELENTLRSLLQEMLPQALAQTVAPIQAELGELRALSLAGSKQPVQPKENFIPNPRSLKIGLEQRTAIESAAKSGSFASLANSSVGLPENFVR